MTKNSEDKVFDIPVDIFVKYFKKCWLSSSYKAKLIWTVDKGQLYYKTFYLTKYGKLLKDGYNYHKDDFIALTDQQDWYRQKARDSKSEAEKANDLLKQEKLKSKALLNKNKIKDNSGKLSEFNTDPATGMLSRPEPTTATPDKR